MRTLTRIKRALAVALAALTIAGAANALSDDWQHVSGGNRMILVDAVTTHNERGAA